ncbi:LuxR C-terminal-related transcriptional regulator [Micromonospora pallida]|jgi:DNA-binding NarL/FixJ family response regulator|uniref:LuxR C-terminal-related transcriptional regulator n=1 Tax=Micromonospora pallida TaxID=145854 RepID=UPI000B86599F|nr:LuxR C-terminal-related transcriptional regulator [Micromonospora pallida]
MPAHNGLAVAPPVDDPLPALEVSKLDRDILRQLAAGYTDEATAVRLNVSPRTVRRRLALIGEQLGVQGRFGLGVAAAQLGLVSVRRR